MVSTFESGSYGGSKSHSMESYGYDDHSAGGTASGSEEREWVPDLKTISEQTETQTTLEKLSTPIGMGTGTIGRGMLQSSDPR